MRQLKNIGFFLILNINCFKANDNLAIPYTTRLWISKMAANIAKDSRETSGLKMVKH